MFLVAEVTHDNKLAAGESVARAVQALAAEPGLEGSIASIFIAAEDEEADPSETSTGSDGSKVCAICHEPFLQEPETLDCGHSFHKKCVESLTTFKTTVHQTGRRGRNHARDGRSDCAVPAVRPGTPARTADRVFRSGDPATAAGLYQQASELLLQVLQEFPEHREARAPSGFAMRVLHPWLQN